MNKILIVDDNKINRKTIAYLLKRTKIDVTLAESGHKCLELVKDNKYDIIFLDHQMPDLNGIDTKILMDEIFGEENFRNEIVWKRSTAHSDSEFYGNNYDMIFFYTKSSETTFNTVYQDYEEEYLARFTQADPDGRKWDSGNITAKGLSGGGYDYEYKGCVSCLVCKRKGSTANGQRKFQGSVNIDTFFLLKRRFKAVPRDFVY